MRVRLEEVCERGSSNLKQSDVIDKTGEYPIFGASGYIGNVSFYHQEKPYVAVVKDGAGIGRTTLNPAKSSVIGTMQYLLPKENVLPEYLCYVVRYMHLEKYFTGATIPHIYYKDYKDEEFNLESIPKQKEIVEVLERIEKLIESRKQELTLLDDFIKSRFVELFGDPICNSKNLFLSPLDDVCTKITDGTHDTPPRYDSGYLLITGKNIRSSGITFDDVEFVSEEDHKIIYSRCNPEYGDVLYTNIGVNYGTACYNNLDYEFSMKNVALLKPNHRLVNGYYLWECLNIMRKHVLSMNQVGGAQTFMGLATIKKIIIPVPQIELQQQFATFVEQTDKLKVEVQKSLEETQVLMESLMQKHFG